MLSPTVKQELLAELPPVMVIESIGASELGMQAMSHDTDSGRKACRPISLGREPCC